MAAIHRSFSFLGYGTRTNSTLTAPSGLADNDILVFVLWIENNIVPTPPTGFTAFTGLNPLNYPSVSGDLYVWWKRAASESGSYTATHASTPGSQGWLIAISGAVTSGSPEDVNPSTNTGTGGTITALSITTVTDGSHVIYIHSEWDGDATINTPPSGSTPTFVERDERYPSYLASANDTGMSPAGATGNKSPGTSTAGEWVATLIAIKAATGFAHSYGTIF